MEFDPEAIVEFYNVRPEYFVQDCVLWYAFVDRTLKDSDTYRKHALEILDWLRTGCSAAE